MKAYKEEAKTLALKRAAKNRGRLRSQAKDATKGNGYTGLRRPPTFGEGWLISTNL